MGYLYEVDLQSSFGLMDSFYSPIFVNLEESSSADKLYFCASITHKIQFTKISTKKVKKFIAEFPKKSQPNHLGKSKSSNNKRPSYRLATFVVRHLR